MESEQSHKSNTSEKKPKIESDLFKVFREAFEKEQEVEEKLGRVIAFMRELLSLPSSTMLKDFWDAKKLCGPLFKEQMNPIKRNHLWSEYTSLSDEARQCKEIMDEQAAFSIEQIELAIAALEGEMERYETLVEQMPPLKFPSNMKKLLKKADLYLAIQKELHLLKTFISRLDALRKEILGTDMRIGHKNRILKRLSKLGDRVFPKRKELIKTLSETLIQDVETFEKEHFSEEGVNSSVPYYEIREEIKGFQGLAKQLTLNTRSFTKTREILSKCWNQVREKEKERKKEVEELSEEHKKNFGPISEKVQNFVAFCAEKGNGERGEILKASSAIQEEMRSISLSREQVNQLRSQIQKARSEALDKIQEKVQQAIEADNKKIQDFKEAIAQVLSKEAKMSLEELQENQQTFQKAFAELIFSPAETYVFKRQFSDLQSFILDKKAERAQSKEEYRTLFDEREDLYEEVKQQIEIYRKEMGGSGLDFEKAMIYRELYDSARIHLDKEVEALHYLEEKLDAD